MLIHENLPSKCTASPGHRIKVVGPSRIEWTHIFTPWPPNGDWPSGLFKIRSPLMSSLRPASYSVVAPRHPAPTPPPPNNNNALSIWKQLYCTRGETRALNPKPRRWMTDLFHRIQAPVPGYSPISVVSNWVCFRRVVERARDENQRHLRVTANGCHLNNVVALVHQRHPSQISPLLHY